MSGLADALRRVLDIAEAAHACVLEDRGNLDDDELAEADANERTIAEARAALAAHDAAVSAGSWVVEADLEIWRADTVAPDRKSGQAHIAPLAVCEIPDDAARIVACVNACTGIADPGALVASVRACLPDLKHYAGTHGTGPDVRLAALLAAMDGAA